MMDSKPANQAAFRFLCLALAILVLCGAASATPCQFNSDCTANQVCCMDTNTCVNDGDICGVCPYYYNEPGTCFGGQASCANVGAGTKTSDEILCCNQQPICEPSCKSNDDCVCAYYDQSAPHPCSQWDNDRPRCLLFGCNWLPGAPPCVPLGGSCGASSVPPNQACCTGQNLLCRVPFTLTNSVCCIESGNPYTTDVSDCCSSVAILKNGQMVCCSPPGGECDADTDCCRSNSFCSAGVCTVYACLGKGESCASDPTGCCTSPEHLLCKGNQHCDLCSGLDVPCNGPNDCCGTMLCDNFGNFPQPICRDCVPPGDKCTGASQCCQSGGTYECKGGRCASPSSGASLCGTNSFGDVMSLSAIAAIAVAALVALAYMVGEAFSHPKLLTWAKTEAMQVLVSVAIVAVVLFAVTAFCTIQVGEMKSVFGMSDLPAIYSPPLDTIDLYGAAALYLENLGKFGIANIAAMRYNMAAYEVRASYQTFECDFTCIYTLSTVSKAPYSGESLGIAVSNNLLGTATAGYLMALFQYFTLLYILNGLFIVFLPIAIVMRSVPFMRQFGGALMGIIIALYIIYPLMLVLDSYIVPGFIPAGLTMPGRVEISGCAGSEIFKMGASPGITCDTSGYNEEGISDAFQGTIGENDMNRLAPTRIADLVGLNTLYFLVSGFLPAVNFIVTAAAARDISRMLGEEADISRLGQMI